MSGYHQPGRHPYPAADPYANPQQQFYQGQQNQYTSNDAYYYGQQEQQAWYDQEAYVDQSMANMSISGQQSYGQPQASYNQSAAAYPEQQWQNPPASSEIVPCDPRFISVSVSAFPSTPALRLNSSLAFTLTTQPLAEGYVDPSYMNPDEQGSLPCVNFGNLGVVRCKACRAYINPYCKFMNGGSQWRCAVCARPNDVQSDYFCDLDSRGERTDKAHRIELSLASYEIVAPAEYMVRPPQPPAFLFAIDVSKRSVESGVLSMVCDTILNFLDYFPGLPRTKIGFITYDSVVHLYSLRSGLSRPQMMILPNLEDLFLPQPEDYLVDLEESKGLITTLLRSLPAIHANTRNVECALGAATMAAFRIINAIGGKVVFFTTSLPSFGPARLKNRDVSSANQAKLQQPATDFYKSWGLKYTRMQVRADIFLFPDQYCDVATIVGLSQFTGGQLYTFPYFDQYRSGDQLRTDLTRCITREQAWEAVLRVRVSKGAKIVGYEGNFFLRGTDLLAVPNCSADDAFLVELGHDDTNPQGAVVIQVALLYTASFGERRIRVHNYLLPVIEKIEDIFYFVDLAALINSMAKKALGVCLSTSMEKGRESMQNACISIISAYRKSTSSFHPVRLNTENDYPETIRYLPMMTLALLKCTAFKDSPLVSADVRSIHLAAVRSLNCQALDLYLRPRIYRIDALSGQEGIYDDSGMVTLPAEINATSQEMFDEGAYLADNGMTLFIWLGRSLSSHLLQVWFGVPSLQGIDPETLQLLPAPEQGRDSVFSRLHNIIAFLRSQVAVCQRIQIVRQPTSDKISVLYEEFLSCLILDRTSTVMSYSGFLSHITTATG